jgi:hypothetical protein
MELLEKIKEKGKIIWEPKYVWAVVLILTSSASFGLGRLSALDEIYHPGVSLLNEPSGVRNTASIKSSGIEETGLYLPAASAAVSNTLSAVGGQVVASKNGTKYHFPWCSGAKRIDERNKIYFESIEAARAAGYTPAANCRGLK